MSEIPQHSYEEIRDVVIDVLLKRDLNVTQFVQVLEKVAVELEKRHHIPQRQSGALDYMHKNDKELAREVFWDLFRQGFITLGTDNANSGWPWFRLTRFSETVLKHAPYRFHDTSSYIATVKKAVTDLSREAELYLDEACASFYSDCLLASTVMLGVAAEAEFLRLVDVATGSRKYGIYLAATKKAKFIKEKIDLFHRSIKPYLKDLPREASEDFDTRVLFIQSVLRIARNDAGHPSGSPPPSREQAYINLQLFIPFARQLMKLRKELV
jgi:hypothetical protein